MSAQTYDWSRFKKQIFITADPQKVFQAWAVPQNIEQWFIAESDYTAPDGSDRPAAATISGTIR